MADIKMKTTLSPPPAKRTKNWIYEQVVSLGLALLLVFAIRSSVVEAFKIPSGSMIPTLLIGDHIFVNKFAYGIKIPFSDLFTDPIYLIKRDGPKHGDIIVFIYPKDPSLYYIKRVIGTPGDTVELKSKVLFINGKEMVRKPSTKEDADQVLKDLDGPRYSREDLELSTEDLDGVQHPVLQDKNMFVGENFGPISVPANHLFVMGDNRDSSNDSRFWGFVPMQNVKGRAFIIWLSFWLDFKNSVYSFRPSRIGSLLK